MNLETSLGWNLDLFHLINAAQSPAHLSLFRFIAQDTPLLVALGMVGWWIVGGARKRRALMIATVALAIGMAINLVITSTTYMARPLQAGIGHTWLAHGLETSFPSDHATLLLSIGLALAISPALRFAGLAITALGVTTAWARVYLGVHFPLDMAASAVISLFAAVTANLVSGALDERVFAPVEQFYVRVFAPVDQFYGRIVAAVRQRLTT